MRGHGRFGPGEGLRSLWVLASIAVLVMNDHVLKGWMPGWLTGHLSDFAGLVFFPLLLQSLIELGASAGGRYREPSNRLLVGCVLVTAFVFCSVQLSDEANEILRWGWGALRWPWDGAWKPVGSWSDPWDLIALPALFVSLYLGFKRSNAGPIASSELDPG